MNATIKGLIKQGESYPLDYLVHGSRTLCDMDARTVLNYGEIHGYEAIADIPREVIDGILSGDKKYRKYIPDDLPRFVSEQRVRRLLECWRGEKLTEDIINDIVERL